MKKIIAFLLCITFTFALAACNNTTPPENPPEENPPAEQPSEQPSESPSYDVELPEVEF